MVEKLKTLSNSSTENKKIVNVGVPIYKLCDVNICSSMNYPNVILHSYLDSKKYIPLEETIMSLRSVEGHESQDECSIHEHVYKTPVFYFIYNTDNYYHFVYDTLPYLISFFYLKKEISDMKLLMRCNSGGKFYKFVMDFFGILGINSDDIVIADLNTVYKTVYVSSSYTHGDKLNEKPKNEIYSLFSEIVKKVKSLRTDKSFPKKFYVSRRSWVHGDLSNMGTNYTTRRNLENETELVSLLESKGYTEIFSEKLDVVDKVLLFNGATNVVGAIGGGLVNVLFSEPECKLLTLVSPTFLEVNGRFVHSLNGVDVTYFSDSEHTEKSTFKRFMRIQSGNIVGEVEKVFDGEVLVNYCDDAVAGWNSEVNYKQILLKKEKCRMLDSGLNSSWRVNVKKLEECIT